MAHVASNAIDPPYDPDDANEVDREADRVGVDICAHGRGFDECCEECDAEEDDDL